MGEADHADKPGEKVPAGVLRGIVPSAGQKLDGSAASLLVPRGDDAVDVADGKPRRHGVSSVGDGLDGAFFAPRELRGKVGGNDDDQHGGAAVDGVGDAGGVGEDADARQGR